MKPGQSSSSSSMFSAAVRVGRLSAEAWNLSNRFLIAVRGSDGVDARANRYKDVPGGGGRYGCLLKSA